MLRTRITFLVILALSILAVVVWLASGGLGGNKELINIQYSNARDVKVFNKNNTGEKNQLITNVENSGQPIKLKSGEAYLVDYSGTDGFANGEVELDLNKPNPGAQLTINPYYSNSKLAEILAGEVATIQNVVKKKYKYIGLYAIQPGKLYHFGDWYGTSLKYTGYDNFNNDTLKVILHKEKGVWQIKTDPPDVSLSKFVLPDVPEDILNEVNSFRSFVPTE